MKLDPSKASLKEGDISYRGIRHDCTTVVEVKARVNNEGTITRQCLSDKVRVGRAALLYV